MYYFVCLVGSFHVLTDPFIRVPRPGSSTKVLHTPWTVHPQATLYPSLHNTEQGGRKCVLAGTCSMKGSALTRDGSTPSRSTPLPFQEAQRPSSHRQEQKSGSVMKILTAVPGGRRPGSPTQSKKEVTGEWPVTPTQPNSSTGELANTTL